MTMLLITPFAEHRSYVIKYAGKWPHCSNIQCFAGHTLAEMQSACDRFSQCTGFTFLQDATFGDGCLKDCGGLEYGGYGEGDSDYHVKIVGPVQDHESNTLRQSAIPTPSGVERKIFRATLATSDAGVGTFGGDSFTRIKSDQTSQSAGPLSVATSTHQYSLWHVGKRPPCSNIQCLAGRMLDEMESACHGTEKCTGFTFTRNATRGGGCLKACSTVHTSSADASTASEDYWPDLWVSASFNLGELHSKPHSPRHSSVPPPAMYRIKYPGKWPHCENIRCHSSVSILEMQTECDQEWDCNGFSFDQNGTLGSVSDGALRSGCLKSCAGRQYGGFGAGDADYWAPSDDEVAVPSGQTAARDAPRSNKYRRKYVSMWPHCSNIQCLAEQTLEEMQSDCDRVEQCTGFTFMHNVTFGEGCLKDCGGREYGGYGEGDSDYWSKPPVRLVLNQLPDRPIDPRLLAPTTTPLPAMFAGAWVAWKQRPPTRSDYPVARKLHKRDCARELDRIRPWQWENFWNSEHWMCAEAFQGEMFTLTAFILLNGVRMDGAPANIRDFPLLWFQNGHALTSTFGAPASITLQSAATGIALSVFVSDPTFADLHHDTGVSMLLLLRPPRVQALPGWPEMFDRHTTGELPKGAWWVDEWLCPALGLTIGGVLHLGGYDASEYFEKYSPHSVAFVEMQEQMVRKMKENLGHLPMVKLIHGAVTDKMASEQSSCEFYVTNNMISSSLQPPAEVMLAVDPGQRMTYKGRSHCFTLDWLVTNEELQAYNFLVMDIEGSELLALQGGVEYLKTTVHAVELEASFRQRQQGAPTKPQLDLFLWENGFVSIRAEIGLEQWGDVVYLNWRRLGLASAPTCSSYVTKVVISLVAESLGTDVAGLFSSSGSAETAICTMMTLSANYNVLKSELFPQQFGVAADRELETRIRSLDGDFNKQGEAFVRSLSRIMERTRSSGV